MRHIRCSWCRFPCRMILMALCLTHPQPSVILEHIFPMWQEAKQKAHLIILPFLKRALEHTEHSEVCHAASRYKNECIKNNSQRQWGGPAGCAPVRNTNKNKANKKTKKETTVVGQLALPLTGTVNGCGRRCNKIVHWLLRSCILIARPRSEAIGCERPRPRLGSAACSPAGSTFGEWATSPLAGHRAEQKDRCGDSIHAQSVCQ